MINFQFFSTILIFKLYNLTLHIRKSCNAAIHSKTTQLSYTFENYTTQTRKIHPSYIRIVQNFLIIYKYSKSLPHHNSTQTGKIAYNDRLPAVLPPEHYSTPVLVPLRPFDVYCLEPSKSPLEPAKSI